MPCNKSLIDQASSVKMAGCWRCALFAFLRTSTSSRSIKTQKENSANIQPYTSIYIWEKKTNKLQVHPYKPVSWSPDELAATKQACRDKLVVYLFFFSHIYFALLLCIEHCFTNIKFHTCLTHQEFNTKCIYNNRHFKYP